MKNMLVRAALVAVLSFASFHALTATAQMQPEPGQGGHGSVPIPTCGECGR